MTTAQKPTKIVCNNFDTGLFKKADIKASKNTAIKWIKDYIAETGNLANYLRIRIHSSIQRDWEEKIKGEEIVGNGNIREQRDNLVLYTNQFLDEIFGYWQEFDRVQQNLSDILKSSQNTAEEISTKLGALTDLRDNHGATGTATEIAVWNTRPNARGVNEAIIELTTFQILTKTLKMGENSPEEQEVKLVALQQIINTYPTGSIIQQKVWKTGDNASNIQNAFKALNEVQTERERERETKPEITTTYKKY